MTQGMVILLLSLLLLLAIGSTVTLGITARQYYLELNRTRLDPLDLAAYPPELAVPTKTVGKQRVLFLGDSRAYSERVIIFDSAQLLADDSGLLQPDYGYDLLHLNDTGYQALNPGLIEVLEKIGHKH